MPQARDGAALQLAPSAGRDWIYPGGEEDDEGVTLFFAVSNEHGSASYTVRLPVSTEGVLLKIGTPEVAEEKR